MTQLFVFNKSYLPDIQSIANSFFGLMKLGLYRHESQTLG